MSPSFRLYSGDGVPLADRGGGEPIHAPLSTGEDPGAYFADDGLRDAVNVALALGQPLLLTGEPGTGKTRLAASLAYELGLDAPLAFNVKTTSTAQELFYRYDSTRHEHALQFEATERPINQFITYGVLGLAILRTLPPGDPRVPARLSHRQSARSVVLIDEIDKAPREFPNDLLNELESMAFTVKETGITFQSAADLRPILVITSNSEKPLPDPFLRRCVFYHIPFPDPSRLREIVEIRLGHDFALSSDKLDAALAHFLALRSLSLRKPPATAEFLAWVQVLARLDLDVRHPVGSQREALHFSYSVLAKSREDLELLRSRSAELRVV